MTNLKQIVTEYLGNTSNAESLMYSNYTKEWGNEPDVGDDTPFEFRSVSSYGGEDCGSDYWNVIEVRLSDTPDETLFVKILGWYQSYSGADYHDWLFVTPKQKTITVYE